jgi:hypothetical protein
MIYVSEGCSISIRVSRLWFRLQPVPFKRINSIAISHSRSNSGSDGIFSRDSRLWLSGTCDGDPRLRSAADCLTFKRGGWLETTADRCNLPEWLAAAPDWLGMTFA